MNVTIQISESNKINAIVEPTFSTGEFSAVVFDEFVYWIEKFFSTEAAAIAWANKKISKFQK